MNHSEQFLKRRKFLLFLPVIIWPFAVLIFWLLGGGGASAASAEPKTNGLNMQLPDAKVGALSALDKLSFYAKAQQDSVKRVELEKMDPNLEEDETEEVVEVSRERVARVSNESYRPAIRNDEPVRQSAEVEQLQEMVKTMQQPRGDPDMDALNGTLRQLVALQQPKMVEKPGAVNERKVLRVKSVGHNGLNGFYGEAVVADSILEKTIRTVVHGEQVVQSGSVIKLRLLWDIVVGGQIIPAGSFVFGAAQVEGERVRVAIHSIQFNQQLFPVALNVIDMDGMEGIYVPGSAAREVVKQSAEQGVQSIGRLFVDQSLTAQATAVGIGAAKNLLSRKVKQVRVTIKSGYQVLLKDEKQGE